jgi:ribosomal protein S18 acetylase RimI-like enzyme
MEQSQIPTDFIIRDFIMSDYDNVLSLWHEGKLPYRQYGRDSRSRIESELERGTTVFLVAEADGRLVGTILGTHDGRKGWLNRLAVDSKSRRQNIARRLVNEVENRFANLGIEVMAGIIEEGNTASMQLFETLGYTRLPIAYYSKRTRPEA